MLATVASASLRGYDGLAVNVEVHVSNGLPGYTIVGLPDATCREARDRVRAAMLSSGLHWPMRKVTINLAPAGVRKPGGALDLAIALGLLAASDQIPVESIEGLGAIGELGLDGSLKPVHGMMCIASAVESDCLVVPATAAGEARATYGKKLFQAENLAELVQALVGEGKLRKVEAVERASGNEDTESLDMSQVLDQPLARLALELSAAGGHNVLMVGAPGAGKTMLAKRLPSVLPDLSSDESLIVSKIHSAAGYRNFDGSLIVRPPFRAPHHGATKVGLLGGGTGAMRPGEISGAHGGVLFLDELGEYPPRHIEALRTPLEEGVIRVSRASRSLELPADFILVAAMNPCPCGTSKNCRCSDSSRLRYSQRLSGPVMDRFDLRIELSPPGADSLFSNEVAESSVAIRDRVVAARKFAVARGVRTNAKLDFSMLQKVTCLSSSAESMLREAVEDGLLSARGVAAVTRVALTVSDIAAVKSDNTQGSVTELSESDVATALSLRSELGQMFGERP